MELNKPPKVVNVLVFQDHFMKHVMAYVTPDQTAKTVAKFLYQGYIFIFGALAKFLSDQGLNVMSNIIQESCKLTGIKKIRTSPYHAQTNGQGEQAHQIIMQMIRKLSEDQKADWANHLLEMVQAYNSTKSAVTGYSPHYLMFGPWPRIPVDFYFPTVRGAGRHKHVNEYIANLQDCLWEACKEAQDQSTVEAWWQKWYYDRWINIISLEPGDLVLVKADSYQGKRKIKRLMGGHAIWSQMSSHKWCPFVHCESQARLITDPPS